MSKTKTHADYREAFLERYHELRGQHISGDLKRKWELFKPYFESAYKPLLPENKKAKILDVGFGEGIFLYWASEAGYTNLHGVDPCKAFTKIVDEIPHVTAEVGLAQDFLANHKNEYDVITIKAVLEHIPKDQVFPLIKQMQDSLKPGGVLIVDVPNMDWLYAQHERYLDFTHEVGFTQESLRDVLGFFFADVSIHFPKDISDGSWLQNIIVHIIRPPLRWLLKVYLYLLSSEGLSSAPIHARNLIARAVKHS